MSASFELDPVARITAGAVGEPGERAFFIQARAADRLVTLLAEKDQVRLLAHSIMQMLAVLPESPGRQEDTEVPAEDLELEEPLVPEWRVGPMSLEYEEDRDRIVLVAKELVEEGLEETAATARFAATRAQARALAEHAEEVCEAGRPRCRLCGFPMDPEGHVCPALDGHREIGS